MITVLKSKIQEAIISGASVECEGSITLSPELMEKADLIEYEQVHVNSQYNEGRIITYVLKGESGCGIKLNGGAANHFRVGEIVHILAFKEVSVTEAEYIPTIC